MRNELRRPGALTAAGLAALLAAIPPAAGASTPVTPGIGELSIRVQLPDPAAGTIRSEVRARVDTDSLEDRGVPLRVLLHTGLSLERVTVGDQVVTVEEAEGFNPKHFWRRPDYKALGAYDHLREISVPAPAGGWSDEDAVVFTYEGTIAEPLHAPEEDYGRSFEETSGLVEERGAYLAPGTGWLPFVPDDLVTFRMEATVPAEWDVVSQGKLESRDVLDGVRVVTLDCPYPMDGIYLIGGPWQLRRDAHGDTDVLTYTYAQDDALTGRYIDATKRYLTRYEEEIGPYPFSKFALVENFWETGYGMPSFTLLGSTVIRLPFIVDTSYGHEILHCWWGNGVFVDASDGNWCEGLTSFMADYAYEEDESPEAARDYRRNQLTGYLNYVTGGRDIPLSAFRERHSGATQAIGYGKSLMVFHMLRDHVGEDAFDRGIRAFYAQHQYRAASWSDLFDAFEASSGEDLGTLEEQWIRRSGAPVLRVTDLEIRPSDGARVSGVIEQDEPAYALDVPVEVTLATGDTLRARIECRDARTPFAFDCDAQPVELRVDPDFDVFRKLHRGEIPAVLSQTMGADSVVIIVPSHGPEDLREAYVTLAEEWARRDGIQVLEEATLLDDPSGARLRVRNAAVWLFGDISLASHAFAGGSSEVGELHGVVKSVVGSPEVPPADHSLVVTLTHPWNRDLSWSWLWLSGAEHAAAIGRKVPHYGKYSYLLFDGATNVGKGTWQRTASPLRIDLRALTPPAAVAPGHG